MIVDNLKENDIFVSTLLNPESNLNDLTQAGLDVFNTQFLTADEYKTSDFVKNAFTNKEGKFDDEAFSRAYNAAASKYSDLAFKNTADGLKDVIEYNSTDIYAPAGSKTKTPTYNIERVLNPYENITGVRSLFGTAESNKSARELAQKNPIFDTETGEYLDKSAEDLGLFGGLISTPLVYAKWHEDGEHIDPVTGRKVTHKKGEYRLNEDGKFFTETIKKKQGYDEEFVALSDILTKEDSWINKIDVFDSDDKEKSAIGTVMKTVASIAPYFIPGVNTVWGGVTMAVGLASVMPAFAKSLEGLALGDKETAFTGAMNLMENYFKRFDNSVSDEGQTKTFGLEQIGTTVSDIFAQLYQMRAAGSLSKLFVNYNGAEKKAFENFMKKHSNEVSGLIANGTIKPTQEGVVGFFKDIAAQTPELKALMDKQSKMSRALSMGYMALITSGDVYKEALDGGYSRRAAGTAALAATLGQYWMMNSLDDRISSWFLDSVVGYNEFANRKMIRDSLKPLWNRIEESVDKIPGLTTEAKQKEFASLFGKIGNGLKNTYYKLLDGTSEFWSRSLAETVEEVSEEAMMDATKGMFDALSYFGFLGNKNKDASFNTIENTFSKEGLIRYAQNALGGFMGGGLFHLQEHYVEPFLRGEKIPKATEIDLIKGIQNGEAEHYKELARELGRRDSSVSPIAYMYGENQINVSNTGNSKSRGEVISDAVIQHIEYLQGILGQYNADLTPDELLSKAIKDRGTLKALQDSDIHKLILDDFDNNIADLIKLKEKLDPLEKAEKPTAEQESQKKKLTKELKELEKKITGFLDGEQEEYYMKAALAYLNPAIRDNIGNVTLYAYAKAKTGKNWQDIEDQDAIRKDYNEFVQNTDQKQQIKTLVDTMDLLEPEFSPSYKKYGQRYADVRRVVIDQILAQSNFNLSDSLNEDNYQLLLNISTATKNSGLKGATLEDILQVKPEVITQPIIKRIYDDNRVLFDSLAQAGGLETSAFLESLSRIVASSISNQPIEQWDSSRIDAVVKQFLAQITATLEGERPDLEALIQTYQTPQNIREDLSKNAIKSYIVSQDVLDNELVRRLKTAAVQNGTNQTVIDRFDVQFDQEFVEAFDNFLEDGDDEIQSLNFTNSEKKAIKDVIADSINNGDSLEVMVDKITEKVLQNLSANDDDRVAQIAINQFDRNLITNFVKNFIDTNSEFDDYRFLEQNKNKEVVNNPLYDLLRQLSFQLSPEVRTTIFDLLQSESTNLAGLYDISEYIKMPDLIEQIKNAKSILSIAKAIVAGMEDDPNTPGRLFGYNGQIKRFLKEFKNGAGAEKYETLDSRTVYSIIDDIDLLISKLDFIEKLSGMNTESQAAEDQKTRDAFNNIIIAKLKAEASKLQVNDISIATPDDLTKLDDDTLPVFVRVGRFQHSMYEKFKGIVDSGTTVEQAITTLFNNLGINIEQVCKSSLDSARLNKDIQSITDYDWIVWLATTLGSDNNDYYYKYRKCLQENQDTSIVPLYIQELNTQIAYSVLADTLGVHNAIQKYIIDHSGGYPADTKNIIFTDGVSGSGKTTVIAKASLQFILETAIWVAAPNNDNISHSGQASKLKDSLGLQITDDKVFNKEQLLKMFITDEAYTKLQADSVKETYAADSLIQEKTINGGAYRCLADTVSDSIFKDVTDPPKLIFIDETTHFNTAELQLLDKAAEKYGFKLITLGDSYQESANIGQRESHIDQVFSWKGPRLGISSRPANVNKKDNIDRFQVALDTYYNELKTTNSAMQANNKLSEYLTNTGLVIKYFEDAQSFAGDKIVDSISVEDLNKLKTLSDGEKIIIVTNLDDAGQIVDTNFNAILQSSQLTESDYELRSPEKIHPKAIQGAESKYCVINDSGLTNQSDSDAIKKLYTIVTRSQEGSLIKLPSNVMNRLHIQNTPTTKPSIYKLPGSNQTAEIKQQRIEDVTKIIGSYAPTGEETTTPPVSSTSPSPTIPSSPAPVLPTSPTPGPSPSPANFEGEVTSITIPSSDKKLICYGFYNHCGLVKDGDKYTNNGSRGIPVDLDGLPNKEFSAEGVQGFFKLKNLIALYPDPKSTQFQQGLRSNQFSKSIATFARELNADLASADDESALEWLKQSITIDDTPYVIGVKMDRKFDEPQLKAGFDKTKLIEKGQPLLLMARRIVLTSKGNVIFSNFITTGALPNSATVATAADTYVRTTLYNAISGLEARAAQALNTKQYVVYTGTEQFVKLGTADGRFVHRKENEVIFDSLRNMEKRCVNIKEVMLISSEQDSSGKYKFVEWAKRFNPAIEQVAIKNGIFTLAGRYMVRASFTNVADNAHGYSVTDHVFVVDLATIDVKTAIDQLKHITGNLPAKRDLLHANSYSQLITYVLQQLNAFGVTPTMNIKTILEQFKAEMAKNPTMHQEKIDQITAFINNHATIDANNLQELFKQNSAITILLTDYLITGTNNFGITTRVGNAVPFPSFVLFQNVSPKGQSDTKGCYPLEEGYMDKLGMTTGHYEPPIFGITENGINTLTEVNTPTPTTPTPTTPTPSTTSSTSAAESFNEFLNGWPVVPGSREEKILEFLKQHPDVLNNADVTDVFVRNVDGIDIDGAYEDLFNVIDPNFLNDLRQETNVC